MVVFKYKAKLLWMKFVILMSYSEIFPNEWQTIFLYLQFYVHKPT